MVRGDFLPLDALREEILEKAKKESYEVLREADSEAKKILLNAKNEREQAVAKAREEAEKVIEREKSERLSAARLEAKMILAEAREEAIKAVEDEVWNKMEKLRKGRDYAKLMEKWIREGANAIGGEAIVYSNKGDAKLVKKIVEEIRGASAASEPIDCAGGVLVTSKDGRVRADATFSALFEENEEFMRRTAYNELFKGEKKKAKEQRKEKTKTEKKAK